MSPAPRAPLAHRLWPVVVGVVVAIVILGLVAMTLGGGGSGGSAGGADLSYSQASGATDHVAQGVSGGPWHLVLAGAADMAREGWIPVNATTGSGCTYTSLSSGGLPSGIYLPASSANYSSGVSAWWYMVYFQPASQEILLVDDVNGTAQPVMTATGSCTSQFANYTTVPSTVVDSTTAASAVYSGANSLFPSGSTFLSQHTNVRFNLFLGLLGGGSACRFTSGPCWGFEYTPCNPITGGGPAGSVPTYYALVNAADGSVLGAFPASASCSSSGTTFLGTTSSFLGEAAGLARN